MEYIYSYLASCCQNWNLALCVGFSLWYTLIPSVLLTVTSYSEDLLKPEILSAADRMISDWLEHIRQIFYHLYEGVYGGGREEGAQGIINNSSPVRQENLSWERGHGQTLTEGSKTNVGKSFDPLGLNEVESKKLGLRRLILACLTACALNLISCKAASGIQSMQSAEQRKEEWEIEEDLNTEREMELESISFSTHPLFVSSDLTTHHYHQPFHSNLQ